MKNIIKIVLVSIIILNFGCKKKNNIDDVNSVKSTFVPAQAMSDFYSFYIEMTRASRTYYIQSVNGVADKPFDDLSRIMATIEGNNAPYDLDVDNMSLDFSSYYYSQTYSASTSEVDTSMTDFYGEEFDLKFGTSNLNAKSDGTISNPTATVYIPDYLYPVTVDSLTTSDEIKAGSIIEWNEDASNDNGVVIAIDYNPSTQTDSVVKANYTDHILIGTITDDDGGYTFLSSDFSDFPDNARLTFMLVRAGYTTFEYQTGDTCTFVGLNSTITGYQLHKP